MMNPKGLTPRHIINKMSNFKDIIFKATREKQLIIYKGNFIISRFLSRNLLGQKGEWYIQSIERKQKKQTKKLSSKKILNAKGEIKIPRLTKTEKVHYHQTYSTRNANRSPSGWNEKTLVRTWSHTKT